MDWMSFLGGFLGGTFSAVVIEIFRRLSRKEKFAELLFVERMKAFKELSTALTAFIFGNDFTRLRRGPGDLYLYSKDLFDLFGPMFEAERAGNMDEAQKIARSILFRLRRELFVDQVEDLLVEIFRKFRDHRRFVRIYIRWQVRCQRHRLRRAFSRR
jgi:hypothetical protein